MDKKEMMAALRAKGIKFSNAATEEKLRSLLGEESGEAVIGQPIPEQSNQLVEILTSISQKLEGMDKRLTSLEQPIKSEVFAIGARPLESAPVKIEQTESSIMFSQVPSDLLAVSKTILNDKFKFECNPLPDQPAFCFTIIVPQEYSDSKEEDRRSKVISNALGANGVREWCVLVKQNVLKFLGTSITKTF